MIYIKTHSPRSADALAMAPQKPPALVSMRRVWFDTGSVLRAR
jgi:hypothetical protein